MKTGLRAAVADPITAAFLAIAVFCAAMGYVGLSASGYWIDELFTLFILNHQGGEAEVVRRALTDTHPPLYYLIAYPWTQAFGTGETAARALSATLLVISLPLLFALLQRAYSLRAAAFGVAVAASSKLFFEQSQNVRNYPLAVLLSTGLAALTLSIRRRAARGEAIPAGIAAAFWIVGLAGSFTHFYLFLAVGAAHLYLLIVLRAWRQRAAVVLSGAAIVAPVAAYVVMLTGHSQQDMENMWFSNDAYTLYKQMLNGLSQAWSWAVIAAIILLTLLVLLRRAVAMPALADEGGERAAAAQLSALVIGGVIAGGLTVSFVVAPSFGARNLAVLAPFFWIAAAGLYDAAVLDTRRRAGQVVIGLMIFFLAANVVNLRGRFLVRAEAWRESAALVAATPGCEGQIIPAVLPDLFGPATPFFRELARNNFYGRYFPADRLTIVTPKEFTADKTPAPISALWRARAAGGCPILAWGVHDIDLKRAESLADDLARTAGVERASIRIRTVDTAKMFLVGITKVKPTAFVFERAPAA